MARQRSIREIEAELASRQKELDQLKAKRNQLVTDLDAIQRRIAAIEGGESVPAAPKAMATGMAAGRRARKAAKVPKATKAAKVAKTPRTRPGRGEGGKTLVDYVEDVLRASGEPMRVKEVMEAVSKTGYKSESKDFYNIVATTLRGDRFKKIARGVYAIK